MTKSASALVSTGNGSRYLQQLCKHWSHRLNVNFDAIHGEISFPNGASAVMDAEVDGIRIYVHAPDLELLARTQDIIQVHLDRFAFREAPLLFSWQAG